MRVASKNFMFDSWTDKGDLSSMMYVAMFKGFLHPLDAPASTNNRLRVFLVSAGAHSRLNISLNEDPHNAVGLFLFNCYYK